MSTRATLLAEIRQWLREAAALNWTDNELYAMMATTLREISAREGIRKRANLAITEHTTEFETSGLSDLHDILFVEYPVGNSGNAPVHRRNDLYGTIGVLDLSSVPTISDGTLDGTVTFTINSRAVTGVGTTFTDLDYGVNGDLIGKSGGTKYYQVADVASDTALTLLEPFEEASGADTINLTKYCDNYSAVRVHYYGTYTVDGSTCNITKKLENVFVLGVTAHAATEYAANYLQLKMAGITTILSSASTAVGNATAVIARAITDIGSQRTHTSEYISAFDDTMATVNTRLAAATSDLTTGIALINGVNTGKDVPENYVEYAKREIETAMGYLDRTKSQITTIDTATYVKVATAELETAKEYLDQADKYLRYATESTNTAQLVSGYKGWANQKWEQYQTELSKLGYVDDHVRYLGARGV